MIHYYCNEPHFSAPSPTFIPRHIKSEKRLEIQQKKRKNLPTKRTPASELTKITPLFAVGLNFFFFFLSLIEIIPPPPP